MVEGIMIGLVVGGVVAFIAGWLVSRKHNTALETKLKEVEQKVKDFNL